MATVMGNGNSNGDGVSNNDRDGNGNCNGDSHGKGDNDKGRVVSLCAGDVQRYGRGDTLPPPPWTQRKVHSPALRHGGVLGIVAGITKLGEQVAKNTKLK